PRRGGEWHDALVAAPVVESEREAEARDADPVEPHADDGTLEEGAQHEEERLERVERVLEPDRFLDRSGDGLRGERALVLATRRADEGGAGGAETRRHLGDRQPGEIAEPP